MLLASPRPTFDMMQALRVSVSQFVLTCAPREGAEGFRNERVEDTCPLLSDKIAALLVQWRHALGEVIYYSLVGGDGMRRVVLILLSPNYCHFFAVGRPFSARPQSTAAQASLSRFERSAPSAT